MTKVDTPFRQTAGYSQRQLLVSSHDFAPSLHWPWGSGIPRWVSRTKHVDQVERTLFARIKAIKTCTGSIQHVTDLRIVTALNILLDPIIHTQVVESEPLLGEVGV